MKSLRRFVSRNTERFIFFLAGVIFSALASAILENLIARSQVILVATTVLALISGIYFFSESRQYIEHLVSRIPTTVRYVEEAHRTHEGIRYKGVIFHELGKLVGEAEAEILALAASYSKYSRTRDEPAREDYLRTLERNIESKTGKFRYVRIHQIDPSSENISLAEYLGPIMTEHSRRIIEMERRLTQSNPDLVLSILKVKTQRLSNFIIVDRRHIGLEITNLTSDGFPYTAGMIFIDDRSGSIVEHFLKYFDVMEQRAQPISLNELQAAQHALPADAASRRG